MDRITPAIHKFVALPARRSFIGVLGFSGKGLVVWRLKLIAKVDLVIHGAYARFSLWVFVKASHVVVALRGVIVRHV